MARGPFEPGALLQDERPIGPQDYTVLASILSDVMLLTTHLGVINVTERQLIKERRVHHVLMAPQEPA